MSNFIGPRDLNYRAAKSKARANRIKKPKWRSSNRVTPSIEQEPKNPAVALGNIRTKKNAKSSRRNGKKGGRPAKLTDHVPQPQANSPAS
jgi:hypothetical protein